MEILYQDDDILVINKPAGLPTLPDGYDPSLPYAKNILEAQYGRLLTVHRLDKQTSGVLIFARTVAAHRSLNTQFERHQVAKIYHALVLGSPGWQERTIDLPLRPNGDRRHRTVVDLAGGKPAVTLVKVLERFDPCCLLEAIPQTGRTHQIRAHLFSMGLAILGDNLYVIPDSDFPGPGNLPGSLIEGMALHARSLEIIHPISSLKMIFEAPYPSGWEETLQHLRHSGHPA